MQEVWLPVVGWEGLYEVSNQGRVRSLSRQVRSRFGTREIQGRILAPALVDGYHRITLSNGEKKVAKCLHTMVAEAFLGPRPEGLQILHGSANRTDNRPENLRYGTPAENQADRHRDGTRSIGERHRLSKLTEQQVKEARRLVAEGVTHRSVAEMFAVDRSTITCVIRGQTWAHLP